MQWNLSTLKSELQAWAEDDSPPFLAALDNIIAMGEQRLLRDLDLELFDQVESGTFDAGSNTTAKPTGDGTYLATRSLEVTDYDGTTHTVLPRSYDFVRDYNSPLFDKGLPKYFAEFAADQWLVAPVPEASFAYTARIQVRPEGLQANNQLTWLSTHCGDGLLYACLIGCEAFLKADNRIAVWTNEYQNKILPAARHETRQMRRSDYSPLQPIEASA